MCREDSLVFDTHVLYCCLLKDAQGRHEDQAYNINQKYIGAVRSHDRVMVACTALDIRGLTWSEEI